MLEHIQDEVENIVKYWNGTVLSTYKKSKDKIKLRCCNNHDFSLEVPALRVGTWCKICTNGDNKDVKESEFRRIVQLRGGTVLDNDTYKCQNRTVQCSKGHIFHPHVYMIRKGSWCKLCGHTNPISAKEKLISIIASRGGQLLTEYNTMDTYYDVICENGHTFTTLGRSLSSGVWCRFCSGNHPSLGEEHAKQTIELNQGILLSSYKNARTKIRIRCKYNHEWEVYPSSLTTNKWCPHCCRSKGERAIMNYLDSRSIQYMCEYCPEGQQNRFDFLVYYNNKHYLIEYDGIQHFEYTEFFHKNMEGYYDRLKRDYSKTLLAINMNISLLRIAYTDIERIVDLVDILLMQDVTLVIYSDEELYNRTWNGVCY